MQDTCVGVYAIATLSTPVFRRYTPTELLGMGYTLRRVICMLHKQVSIGDNYLRHRKTHQVTLGTH